MPEYVIEREIAGAGKLTAKQLRAISQASCIILNKMGPQIRWIQSYVSTHKIYCVYTAPNKQKIVEHAQQNGLPANMISEVAKIISPASAGYFID